MPYQPVSVPPPAAASPGVMEMVQSILMNRLMQQKAAGSPLKMMGQMPPQGDPMAGGSLLGLKMSPSLYSSGQNGLPEVPGMPYGPPR